MLRKPSFSQPQEGHLILAEAIKESFPEEFTP